MRESTLSESSFLSCLSLSFCSSFSRTLWFNFSLKSCKAFISFSLEASFSLESPKSLSCDSSDCFKETMVSSRSIHANWTASFSLFSWLICSSIDVIFDLNSWATSKCSRNFSWNSKPSFPFSFKPVSRVSICVLKLCTSAVRLLVNSLDDANSIVVSSTLTFKLFTTSW